MKNRSVKAGILLAAALTALSGTAAWGAQVYSTSVRNRIATGDISIDLAEYQTDETGEETPYQGTRQVQPSEIVSKIPRITNLAMPCYVRVKLESGRQSAEDSGEERAENPEEPIPEENYLGISGEWLRAGDYYYYTEVLGSGETVDVFQALRIPEDWTGDRSGEQFFVQVTAEAVQAANFQPDFSSEDPWKDQEVEICVHEADNGPVYRARIYQGMSVELDPAADELLAVPGDFFENLSTTMPGDHAEDQILLENRMDSPAELFFSTHIPEELTEEERALLTEYRLEIRLEDEVLFEGDLGGETLAEPVSLGRFEPGEEETLEFVLELPAQLDNHVAKRETDVDWIFTARRESSPAEAPKTGEGNAFFSCLALALLSGLLCAVSVRKGRERRKDPI